MSVSGEAHYQRMASIQQSMHQREKRRLQLERELFASSRSDKRVSQMKRSKLHRYLKEICDREARAKIRNLELLRDVECIEIGMKEYSPDHGPLQQQKDEFFRKIANFTEARGIVEQTHVPAEVKGAQEPQQVGSTSHQAKDSVQPPAIVSMGRQTSTESSADAAATSVHSRRALHHSPDRSQYSGKHPPSGLLKDFRAGGGDAASDRARLSDDISGSNDSPDGSNLSDKHERTTARLPSVPAAGGAPFGSDDGQRPSPLVTLTGPEMNRSPRSSGGGSSSPAKAVKNISAAHAEACEVAPQTPMTEGEEKVVGHLMPETATGKDTRHTPGMCEDDGTAGSDVQLSDSSESDRSLSLTQSELDEDEEEDEDGDEAPERSATSAGSDDRSRHSPESASGSDDSPQRSCESSAPVENLERLSQEGLFHLLDSIEGCLQCEKDNVYGNSSADNSQLNRITSLCNRRAGVTDEDLEACGAVVLRGLQRLSWNTKQGCVLPREVVSAHQSSTEPNEISASLTPDAARLWDRWFKHALLLKERSVLSEEHLVQLFTPLLLERHATYGHQAKVLLRTLVSRSSEECPSAEDRSDSPSPSSSPGPAAEAARPTQELQSSEEDSQDESPVESVPIRETKAYQLLKQSAMQERLPSSEEEEDDAGLSGINHWRDEDLGRAKRSSHQDPYPRTNAASSKSHSAPRSKAFLCDSDESNSDIEAALRPQPLSTNADDFNDFAD